MVSITTTDETVEQYQKRRQKKILKRAGRLGKPAWARRWTLPLMSDEVQSVKDPELMLAGIAHADKKTKHGRHMTYHTDDPNDVRLGKMSYLASYQVLFSAAAKKVDIPDRRGDGEHDDNTTISKAGSTSAELSPNRFTMVIRGTSGYAVISPDRIPLRIEYTAEGCPDYDTPSTFEKRVQKKMKKFALGASYNGSELTKRFYCDGLVTDDSPLAKIFLDEFIEYKAEWWIAVFSAFVLKHARNAARAQSSASQQNTPPAPATESPSAVSSSSTESPLPGPSSPTVSVPVVPAAQVNSEEPRPVTPTAPTPSSAASEEDAATSTSPAASRVTEQGEFPVADTEAPSALLTSSQYEELRSEEAGSAQEPRPSVQPAAEGPAEQRAQAFDRAMDVISGLPNLFIGLRGEVGTAFDGIKSFVALLYDRQARLIQACDAALVYAKENISSMEKQGQAQTTKIGEQTSQIKEQTAKINEQTANVTGLHAQVATATCGSNRCDVC